MSERDSQLKGKIVDVLSELEVLHLCLLCSIVYLIHTIY